MTLALELPYDSCVVASCVESSLVIPMCSLTHSSVYLYIYYTFTSGILLCLRDMLGVIGPTVSHSTWWSQYLPACRVKPCSTDSGTNPSRCCALSLREQLWWHPNMTLTQARAVSIAQPPCPSSTRPHRQPALYARCVLLGLCPSLTHCCAAPSRCRSAS